jgi:hypothetical protein
MASAGTVTVDFAAETAKFTAELKKVRGDLAILKKDSAQVSQTLSKFGSNFRNLVTFGAALATVRAVVRATAEAEAAQAQLNNALAAAGANVKAASAEYQAYATELQRATTFGDEAIMQVQTLLLSFEGLSGQTVKRATAAVLDLSTRMGIDAPAAAKMLGKALADPEKGITAMTRAGVIFTDAERERIKTMVSAGEVGEAQVLILSKLEKNFGGAAAAAKDTFGGSLKGLQNAMGDLFEGDSSSFGEAAKGINALTDAISSPEFKSAVGYLVSSMAAILEFLAKGAAGWSIIMTRSGGNRSVDIDLQIEDLIEAKKTLERALFDAPLFTESMSKALDKQLAEIDAKIQELRVEQQKIFGLNGQKPNVEPASTALDFVTGAGERIESDDAREAREKAEKEAADERKRIAAGELAQSFADAAAVHEIRQDMVDDALRGGEDLAAQSLDNFLTAQTDMTDILREQAEERAEIERETQERINEFQAAGLDAAIGLMQSGSKVAQTIGKVAFAYQKAQAVASTLMSTREAVVKTYARLGYPWGIPAAAAMAALGAAQVASILSTNPSGGGGGSVGGSSGAGASIGAPNNRVFNDSGDAGGEPGVQQQRALQVVFAGPVYGMGDFKDQLIDMLREEVDDRDVVIFSGNSRQAQELKAA